MDSAGEAFRTAQTVADVLGDVVQVGGDQLLDGFGFGDGFQREFRGFVDAIEVTSGKREDVSKHVVQLKVFGEVGKFFDQPKGQADVEHVELEGTDFAGLFQVQIPVVALKDLRKHVPEDGCQSWMF